VWPIPAILSPFAAVYYPLGTLPVSLQWMARLMPPSYVFEGMRAVVNGRSFSAESLVVAFALSVIYILVAYWFFARVFHYAVETGLIARYSAETVG
jgi:ABC-2 type transport system permease protein